jgi:hypothetical protein
MLLISGTFGTIWGLGAVLNDEVVTVGGRGELGDGSLTTVSRR